MPTPDYTIKRNDFGLTITGQFLDADGAISVAGYTSTKLYMTPVGSDTATINGRSFTIVDEDEGTWSFEWADGDTETEGYYKLELEVIGSTWRRTFPTSETDPYLIVLIQPDLGNEAATPFTGMSFDFSEASNSSYLALV